MYLMISFAFIFPFSRSSRTNWSTIFAPIFNFSAAFLNAAHISSERISSQTMTFSISVGKKYSLIFLMISWTLVIPLATISLITFSTFAIETFTFAANSLIFLQISSSRTSSHLTFEREAILSSMYLMISFAFVFPFSRASRMYWSTIFAPTFNFSAAFLNVAHTSSERISSQTMTFSTSVGKKYSLIFLMISWILVTPLATISFMTFSTFAIEIFTFAATSLIFLQISSSRTSSHLTFERAAILSSMYLMISFAFVFPLSRASRMNWSTILAPTFNFSAAFLNVAHISLERPSS